MYLKQWRACWKLPFLRVQGVETLQKEAWRTASEQRPLDDEIVLGVKGRIFRYDN